MENVVQRDRGLTDEYKYLLVIIPTMVADFSVTNNNQMWVYPILFPINVF